MVRATAVYLRAVMSGGRGLLDCRRPHRKPSEALRGGQGQRYSVSRSWGRNGSYRQRDRRRSGAVLRIDRVGGDRVIGVAILGSTGSIGESTLDVVARHPDRYRLVAIGANRNVTKLAEQIARHRPAYAALADETAAAELRNLLAQHGAAAVPTRILAGAESLTEIAALAEVDAVMAAIVGAAGLRSTLAAARAGKRLLLANKEALEMSGNLIMRTVSEGGAPL